VISILLHRQPSKRGEWQFNCTMEYNFRIVWRDLLQLSLIALWTRSFSGVTSFCPEQTEILRRRGAKLRAYPTGVASKQKGMARSDAAFSLTDIDFDLVRSICDIPPEEWDSCLSRDSSPFMQHSWLRCLEESGCASAETGWMASHVAIRSGDRVCGFIPVS
jgi:Peptidogalycan biosysnthesis/recognition